MAASQRHAQPLHLSLTTASAAVAAALTLLAPAGPPASATAPAISGASAAVPPRPAHPHRPAPHRPPRRGRPLAALRRPDAVRPVLHNAGQAVHGVHGYVHTGKGSHGCVNLMHDDARALWKRTRTGDRVYVWGARPARLK